MGTAELSPRLTFESANAPWDAIASLALARFVRGEEPFVQELRVAEILRAIDPPPVGSVLARVTDADTDRALASGARVGRRSSSATGTGRPRSRCRRSARRI